MVRVERFSDGFGIGLQRGRVNRELSPSSPVEPPFSFCVHLLLFYTGVYISTSTYVDCEAR
jgi:hypothetical protein